MCAISSFTQSHPYTIESRLWRVIVRSAIPHGKHSIGLAHIDAKDNSIRLWKRAVHPDVALYNNSRRFESARAFQNVLCHTRWASVGAVTDENAHPFAHIQADGSPIVYCHNGTITNYSQFGNFAVDSQCLGGLVEARTPYLAEGSASIVWLDQNGLMAYRQNQVLTSVNLRRGDESATVIVSRNSQAHEIIALAVKLGYAAWMNPLQEGIAYRVNHDGVTEEWNVHQALEEHRRERQVRHRKEYWWLNNFDHQLRLVDL